MDITRKTHRYREQTSGYQWGEGRGEGQDRARRVKATNCYVENKKSTRMYCSPQGN